MLLNSFWKTQTAAYFYLINGLPALVGTMVAKTQWARMESMVRRGSLRPAVARIHMGWDVMD